MGKRIRSACLTLLLWPALIAAEALPGFTVSPPPGEDWREVQRNAVSVAWMRRTSDRDISFGAAVLTSRLNVRFDDDERFLAWVQRNKNTNPDPDRFEIREASYAARPHNGARCVSYRTVIADRAMGRLLQVAGRACLHPDAPQRYFDIQYSARLPAGAVLDGELIAEGEDFVESFRFAAPPEDGDWSIGPGAPVENQRDAA